MSFYLDMDQNLKLKAKSKGSRLLCSDVFTFEGKSLIISHEIN